MRLRAIPRPEPGLRLQWPMESATERALRLLETISRHPGTGSVLLTAEYRRGLERLEARPENQTGIDKTWVLDVVRASRETFAHAVRTR